MAQRKTLFLATLLSFSTLWSAPSFSANSMSISSDASPPQATFVLSQEEFVEQRKFMLDDLDGKIKLLIEARQCAEKSTTPVAFQECNQKLIDNVRAQMAQQQAQKKAEEEKKAKSEAKDKK